MQIAYLGNFTPQYSTENEYLDAFVRDGHTVGEIQEGDPAALKTFIDTIGHWDMVVWTRTRDLAERNGAALQWQLAAACRKANVPLVGLHLDIWWGLPRQEQIDTDPYFQAVNIMFTADGDPYHQQLWANRDILHRWLLPGISERWVGVGTPQPHFASDIAFVGSWQGGYHPEAEHRHQLVKFLQDNYPKQVRFWPEPGRPAIRGRELNDLYASARIVVGDSCVLPGRSHYCSDRIPETLGRGGPLLHPKVDGINAKQGDAFFGMPTWTAGDWEQLKEAIDDELEDPIYDYAWRDVWAETIRAKHTYTVRVRELIDMLEEEKLL